jgi:hypothetical protein
MKQRATVLAAAGLILAACSSIDYEADVASAEKEAAEDACIDCVWISLARHDDGNSDPVSVANGIQPTCVVLYEKLTQTVRATTQKRKHDARAMYKDGEIRAIANAVLIYRSQKLGAEARRSDAITHSRRRRMARSSTL